MCFTERLGRAIEWAYGRLSWPWDQLFREGSRNPEISYRDLPRDWRVTGTCLPRVRFEKRLGAVSVADLAAIKQALVKACALTVDARMGVLPGAKVASHFSRMVRSSYFAPGGAKENQAQHEAARISRGQKTTASALNGGSNGKLIRTRIIALIRELGCAIVPLVADAREIAFHHGKRGGECWEERTDERMSKMGMSQSHRWLGSILMLSGLLFSWESKAAEGVATAQSWPMFRGNPGLTGISPAQIPAELDLLWTYKTEAPVRSSAAIVGGKIYVGSDDEHLHCIDAATGKQVWTFKTGGPIESSPLVLGEHVYVGSSDGALYAVDANSGKEVWKLQTEDKILGGPNWVKSPDGKETWILAGSYDYRLYSVEAGSGKTNWTYETQNYINGTPAVAEGKTVFGGCDALLHVISLKDGSKIKEVEAGAYIAGSGALEKGQFYIGHYENEFICADLEEGKIAWSYQDRQFPYFSSPALTQDKVVFGGRDKKLHCLNKETGEKIWDFATRGKVDSSPVIIGDKVLVGSADGRLYMVGLETGKEIWSFEIGESIISSPAVVNGQVVIGSEDGNVYAFGKKRKDQE